MHFPKQIVSHQQISVPLIYLTTDISNTSVKWNNQNPPPSFYYNSENGELRITPEWGDFGVAYLLTFVFE
jgi:hypothetical protein